MENKFSECAELLSDIIHGCHGCNKTALHYSIIFKALVSKRCQSMAGYISSKSQLLAYHVSLTRQRIVVSRTY